FAAAMRWCLTASNASLFMDTVFYCPYSYHGSAEYGASTYSLQGHIGLQADQARVRAAMSVNPSLLPQSFVCLIDGAILMRAREDHNSGYWLSMSTVPV